MVRALATHRGTSTEAGYVVELCPGYIVAASGAAFGRTTAVHLWSLFRAAEVFTEVSVGEARQLGAYVRTLRHGDRYGRFVVLAPAVRSHLATLLDASDLGTPVGGDGWEVLPCPEDLARVVPGPRGIGRPRKSRCPFHADAHPSASLWLNVDGVSGAGICYACARSDGTPLTFALRVDANGIWWARKSGGQEEGGEVVEDDGPPWPPPVPADCAGSPVGVTDRDFRGELGPSEFGLWRVPGTTTRALPADTSRDTLPTVQLRGTRSRWLDGHRYAAGDLLSVMRRADARSQWDRVVSEAHTACAWSERTGRPVALPDKLFAVSQSEPTYAPITRHGEECWRVDGFRAVGQRYVLFDLDGDGVLSDAELAAVLAAVAQITATDPHLSGMSTTVRTSGGGLQVTVELAREVRGDAGAWWRAASVRSWYAQAAARLAVAAGGALHVDMSAAAPGRLGRRPGWRAPEGGGVYRAHLVGSTERRGDMAA